MISYTFKSYDSDTAKETSLTFHGEEDATWVTLLTEFKMFLSGLGYVGVEDRIAIDLGGVCDEWDGAYFEREDE